MTQLRLRDGKRPWWPHIYEPHCRKTEMLPWSLGPRKGQTYTLLLDGGLVKGQLAPHCRALGAMIKKFYNALCGIFCHPPR